MRPQCLVDFGRSACSCWNLEWGVTVLALRICWVLCYHHLGLWRGAALAALSASPHAPWAGRGGGRRSGGHVWWWWWYTVVGSGWLGHAAGWCLV